MTNWRALTKQNTYINRQYPEISVQINTCITKKKKPYTNTKPTPPTPLSLISFFIIWSCSINTYQCKKYSYTCLLYKDFIILFNCLTCVLSFLHSWANKVYFISKIINYENKVLTVMVTNFTNMNKTNNHLSC